MHRGTGRLALAALLALAGPPLAATAPDGDGAITLQPVPRTAMLAEEGTIVWGASMVRDDEGTCHLFYCRWKGRLQKDWYMKAEIVRAEAKTPLGPYAPKEVVLGKRPEGAKIWDGLAAINPTVVKFDDTYYLYYTGSNGAGRKTKDKDGNILAQRIGVAVADHPAGPWKRGDTPLLDLSASGNDASMVSNPSVTRGDDGRYFMVYKGAGGGKKSGIFLFTAFADSPTGPFQKTNRKILQKEGSRFAVEDPFTWWQDGKYRIVADDQNGDFSGEKGLILFESKDGAEWTPSDPFVLSRCKIRWADGEVQETHHFERPQIWLENGKPAVLFAAIATGDRGHFNVHVPLK
jgi:hypothetical protein